MTPPEQITPEDLNAFVDGELDAVAADRVALWLQDHPEDQARVDAYFAQNNALAAMFDPVLQEETPAALQEVFAPLPARVSWPKWGQMAAAVVLVLAGVAGGWGLRGTGAVQSPDLPRYVERAVGAHLVYAAEVLHPVEVGAAQQDHLVAWLSKRLGSPLKAPVLLDQGFSLVGGRLLAEGDEPAAQFMYEDETGRRVTVYLRSAQGKDTAFKFYGDAEASAFYWVDGPFAYALTGEIPRAELMDVAHVVYGAFAS